MLPWKMLFRFVSATVLFATGGLAAGAELPVPFDVTPAAVPAPAPVADVTTTTTTGAEVDVPTTTTSAPAGPEVVEVPVTVTVPAPLPVVTDRPADPAPSAPAPVGPTDPAERGGLPAPAPIDPPPAVPLDADAPPVCAAAKKAKACGPVGPAADNDHGARVQRCQDWWNSLAQAFEQNQRPEWAARARRIAGRCDAVITRWEKAQQRWEERRRDGREKGDHNGDGHPDNGWHNKEERRDGDGRDRRDRDERPASQPAGAKADKISRHSEGRQ